MQSVTGHLSYADHICDVHPVSPHQQPDGTVWKVGVDLHLLRVWCPPEVPSLGNGLSPFPELLEIVVGLSEPTDLPGVNQGKPWA